MYENCAYYRVIWREGLKGNWQTAQKMDWKIVNFMHTYLLGFAIIILVNTPNTLYSFLLPP